MHKLFLIEDDPVVVEIYRKKFLNEGFEVSVVADGLEAMRQLPLVLPDVVVLDLMIPKFNGAEVLRFIRSNEKLRHVKVVIFSNAYMTDVALDAAKVGADASLLKASCTPRQLIEVVKTLLDGTAPTTVPTPLAAPAAAPEASARPAASSPATAAPIASLLASPSQVRPANAPAAPPMDAMGAKLEFARQAPAAVQHLLHVFRAFAQPGEPQFRIFRLQDLHRQCRFFCDLAERAGLQRTQHLATALESLLLELQERPRNINPSTLQTIETTLTYLVELTNRSHIGEEEPVIPTNFLAVLVVDDEPLSNRALVNALSRAQVKPTSADTADKAMELYTRHHYDLFLLDYLMPGMDGLELYRRIRAVPRYAHTPVIFVTSATDFRERAADALARGDEVIQKPILPIELAVKSLTLLMKNQTVVKK